jgi:hypothetical protein
MPQEKALEIVQMTGDNAILLVSMQDLKPSLKDLFANIAESARERFDPFPSPRTGRNTGFLLLLDRPFHVMG